MLTGRASGSDQQKKSAAQRISEIRKTSRRTGSGCVWTRSRASSVSLSLAPYLSSRLVRCMARPVSYNISKWSTPQPARSRPPVRPSEGIDWAPFLLCGLARVASPPSVFEKVLFAPTKNPPTNATHFGLLWRKKGTRRRCHRHDPFYCIILPGMKKLEAPTALSLCP